MYWTVGIEGGPKRVNHAAATIGDKVFSFGGYCNDLDYLEIDDIDVYVLDTVILRWKRCKCTGKKNSIPFQRYGHTVVAYKNKIYLWGGRNEVRACNRLYCFDPDTCVWTTPKVNGTIPVARDGHSACVINGVMYVFAGYLDIPGIYTQEICALNFDTFTWEHISTREPKPIYRDFHTATAYNGLMYVWGGREVASGWHETDIDGEYGSQMYVFNPVTREWRFIEAYGDIPIGRRSHSASENSNMDKIKSLGSISSTKKTTGFLFIPDPSADSSDVVSSGDPDGRLVDHSDLYVLDFEPSLKTLTIMAVLKNNLDTSILPWDLRCTLKYMTQPNKIFWTNQNI
ncbi:Kelch domain-containing protein 3 [Armadillidium nasatum]|uniref:Kelch domain-containing protein 3 n=1 Tax=Armadillidium nasatum TaxID=96803 RepID=A0A5N5SMA1_9CRUS|nr:Kelch domain-containing protein 3 [Armadillidium nasatum]